jgi:hypothetical protein
MRISPLLTRSLVVASSLFVARAAFAQQPPPAAAGAPPPAYAPPPPGAPGAPPTAYAPQPGYPPAGYPPPPPQAPPPPPPEKRFGVGYKIGNGLGFIGADLVIAPVNHLAFDLQFNYLSFSTSTGTATGYGLAPAVQGRLFEGQVSTPYLGLGFLRASMSLSNVKASANGFFANVGYEWRWESGLGILLGGGVAVLGTVHATDGVTTIDQEGGIHPNLEVGLRYMFL